MRLFYLSLIIILFYGHAEAREMQTVFDKPIKKQIIPLPNPNNPDRIAKVSCFYYPQFMVKEVDMGEKGAAKLSITPLSASKALDCKENNLEEIEIKDWFGYFSGVKGGYVFFDSDDGYDGGVPFAVFSGKDGRKLFDDSSDNGAKALRHTTVSKNGLTFRYHRVFVTSCSLYRNNTCWDLIKKETGITGSAPNCDKAYELEKEKMPEYAKEIEEYKSVIGYEAKITYKDGNLNISSVPGKVSCWLPS